MARPRSGPKGPSPKGPSPGGSNPGAQKEGIKSSLAKLINEKKEARFYARYLAQIDVERVMGVGDWNTWERQFERNFEIPLKQGEPPPSRPKLTRLSKFKKTDNPF